MAVYEQILHPGKPLGAPLGFSFSATVYPERATDANSWTNTGVPACQAAQGRGDTIGFLFFRRTGKPTWAPKENNFAMDDPTKDYLCAAYAIPAQTRQNWAAGVMIRDYHRRHFGLLNKDGPGVSVTLLWEGTVGGAKFDIDSGNAIFKALRSKSKLSEAASELAKTRHVGGAEGQNEIVSNGWGWQGQFGWTPGVMPTRARANATTTPWVRAQPSGPRP